MDFWLFTKHSHIGLDCIVNIFVWGNAKDTITVMEEITSKIKLNFSYSLKLELVVVLNFTHEDIRIPCCNC